MRRRTGIVALSFLSLSLFLLLSGASWGGGNDDAKPKLIVSASCGIEPGRVVEYKPLLDGAIEMASHKPKHCIIYQREMAAAVLTPGRDLDWDEAMASAEPHDCVPVAATDPLYILYTSGTTEWMAPRRVTPSMAITASGIIGM